MKNQGLFSSMVFPIFLSFFALYPKNGTNISYTARVETVSYSTIAKLESWEEKASKILEEVKLKGIKSRENYEKVIGDIMAVAARNELDYEIRKKQKRNFYEEYLEQRRIIERGRQSRDLKELVETSIDEMMRKLGEEEIQKRQRKEIIKGLLPQMTIYLFNLYQKTAFQVGENNLKDKEILTRYAPWNHPAAIATPITYFLFYNSSGFDFYNFTIKLEKEGEKFLKCPAAFSSYIDMAIRIVLSLNYTTHFLKELLNEEDCLTYNYKIADRVSNLKIIFNPVTETYSLPSKDSEILEVIYEDMIDKLGKKRLKDYYSALGEILDEENDLQSIANKYGKFW